MGKRTQEYFHICCYVFLTNFDVNRLEGLLAYKYISSIIFGLYLPVQSQKWKHHEDMWKLLNFTIMTAEPRQWRYVTWGNILSIFVLKEFSFNSTDKDFVHNHIAKLLQKPYWNTRSSFLLKLLPCSKERIRR